MVKIICLLYSISIFYDKSYWRKWRMLTFWFLSRLRKSVVSWRCIFPLLPCPGCLWSNNTYKSAKRDLFPHGEGNCGANIMSNQWRDPCNVCLKSHHFQSILNMGMNNNVNVFLVLFFLNDWKLLDAYYIYKTRWISK